MTERRMRLRPTSYRTKTVPMPEDLYATTDPAPLVVPPEGPIAHTRNAAQIVQFAIDEARGLTFVETVAVRNRLSAAIEQLEGARPRLQVVKSGPVSQADGDPT